MRKVIEKNEYKSEIKQDAAFDAVIAMLEQAEDDIELLEIDPELLNEMEPEAGEASDAPAVEAVQDEVLFTSGRLFSSIDAVEADEQKAIGALEETEQEDAPQTVLNTDTFNAPVFAFVSDPRVENAVIATVDQVVSAPEIVEPVFPDADIKLSNATSNQAYINNDDHYALEPDVIGKMVKLYGDEIDVGGVSDSAQVRYGYKTESFFKAVLKSSWNSVKNIEVESADLSKVVVKNFVHADISLSGDENKIINIIDAKRGFIETDGGNDKVSIKALSNGAGWSNIFDIDTGAGNDRINVKGASEHTVVRADGGEGNDVIRSANGDDILYGDSGRDKLFGRTGDDLLIGGEGNDVLRGGEGVDVAVFMGTIDEYVITQRGGKFIIKDTVEGRDGRDVLRDVEGVVFGAEAMDIEDIIAQDDPLQDMIDDFVHGMESNPAAVDYVVAPSAGAGVPDFGVFKLEDIQVITETL